VISGVVKLLGHSTKDVFRAAIDYLSRLGAQGIYSFPPDELSLLRLFCSGVAAGDPPSDSRCYEVVGGLEFGCSPGRDRLLVQSRCSQHKVLICLFPPEASNTEPLLKRSSSRRSGKRFLVSRNCQSIHRSDGDVRQATINCLSSLTVQGRSILDPPGDFHTEPWFTVELQQVTKPTISVVMRLLQDSDKDVCRTAIDCFSSLAAQGIYSFIYKETSVLDFIPSGVAAGYLASNFWCHKIP
jgi:hypothetical protein